MRSYPRRETAVQATAGAGSGFIGFATVNAQNGRHQAFQRGRSGGNGLEISGRCRGLCRRHLPPHLECFDFSYLPCQSQVWRPTPAPATTATREESITTSTTTTTNCRPRQQRQGSTCIGKTTPRYQHHNNLSRRRPY